MHFFRASAIAGLPALLAPVAMAFAFFVDPSVFASLPLSTSIAVLLGSYLVLLLCIYALTRSMHMLGILSRRNLFLIACFFGGCLGFLLSYNPASLSMSAVPALLISTVIATYALPVIFVWWHFARHRPENNLGDA